MTNPLKEIASWDPLEVSLPADFEIATKKRGISNILKSYTGWYDPISELIQNALDALDHRSNIPGQKFVPQLWITIDLQNGALSVTDNGIGFPKEHFRHFLAPMVSFKSKTDRGQKGVGTTYLAYGFNYLQAGTKTPDYVFVGTIKNGRAWVDDEDAVVPRPTMIESEAEHKPFESIDRGATFTLKLIGENIRPRDLSWTNATTAEQWAAILRLKTPLGGVYFGRTKPITICHLEVIDQAGSATSLQLTSCTYLLPHEAIAHSENYLEIKHAQRELIDKHKDPTRLPPKYLKLNGVYAEFSTDEIVDSSFRITLNPDEKRLAKEFGICCYGYFGHTTRIWDKFNDDVLKLRQGLRILKGGLQLAANCMPQGELYLIPLTKNIGYQHQTHVIVHFGQADPDLGRKGFQPELVQLAQKIAVSLVTILQDGRSFLKADTGESPEISEDRAIHDWIKDQEAHENEHPLVISRQDVFLPGKEPLMTACPRNEQDVVALFNQLLAGGVIRGVKMMASSQHKQYDGICRLILKFPREHHAFDKNKNPLGLSEIPGEMYSKPYILEYKYSFDALIDEFENEAKSEKEVDLVVTWETGNSWQKKYQIVSLLDLENLQHRYFHGATHVVYSLNSRQRVFPMIVLSELISYINNPDSVQASQKEVYRE